MWALKAFLLGASALGAVTYAVSAVLALMAQVAGRELEVALGPLLLVSVERAGATTATTLGLGLALLAFAGGLVNVGAAVVLRHRSADRSDSVD